VKISGNDWKARWYRGYVARGGFGRDPENLCRFLRVLLIWAPIRWFFCEPPDGGPPPITWTFLGLIAGTLLYVMGNLAAEVYNASGLEGFYATPSAEYGWATAGLIIVAIGIVAGALAGLSGFWKWYRTEYRVARAGGLCTFIEFKEPDAKLLPVEAPAKEIKLEYHGITKEEIEACTCSACDDECEILAFCTGGDGKKYEFTTDCPFCVDVEREGV